MENTVGGGTGYLASSSMGESHNVSVRIEAQHALVTAALTQLVERLGLDVTDEAEAEADVVLVFPTGNPTQLGRPVSDTPTLVMTNNSDDEVLLGDLLLRGYAGYLRPDSSPSVLARALRAVANGDVWAERRVVLRALEEPRRLQLTPRQQEVLSLVVRGHSNQQIAEDLGISLSTVKAHITTLLEKHGVKSRLLLVARYAEEDGLRRR